MKRRQLASLHSEPNFRPMTAKAILDFLEASPFRPFTLVTASGEKYYIPHEDYVTFSPSRRVALVFRDEELFSALDVLTITDIQPGGRAPKIQRRRRAA
jgi:hypothetical protein